jgi:Beta-galactosidase
MSRMNRFNKGASLSILACEAMQISHLDLLEKSMTDLGIKRFRLMTYWDRCEKVQGKYDFCWVDEQLKIVEKYDGEVTMCLGFKQPRWPEGHQPEWAKSLSSEKWQKALMKFLKATVLHFKDSEVITSWQLENEALNRGFGLVDNFDRSRLVEEFNLVKKLDKTRTVIMSLSNSYGLPLRSPRPDLHGFSIYLNMVTNGKRSYKHMPFFGVLIRTGLIQALGLRPSFIHELQCEPWGKRATEELDDVDQFESMSIERFKKALRFAKLTNLKPVDLWGLEWWYWRKLYRDDDRYWEIARSYFSS